MWKQFNFALPARIESYNARPWFTGPTAVAYQTLALIISIGLMLIGHGLQLSLVPTHAAGLGWATPLIGYIGTAYFCGFMLGCWLIPKLLARAGYIRVLLCCSGLSALAPLLLEVTAWFWVWVIMRLVAGFCVAAISAAVEGWLNEAGMARNRARAFSIYVLVALSAVALGQVLFGLLPAEFRFRMAALFIMISFIPLGLLANEPENTRSAPQFHLLMLRQIPLLASAGMFLVGIVSGCIWTMTPLFAESRGLDGPAIGYTMTAVIAGSVILQWPIGLATDRLGSRFVMLLCAAVNLAVCGMFIFGQVATLMSLLYLLVGLFGGTSLTLYAVCATEAQASSSLGRVQIAALMLLLYGFGAALGPLASGLLQSADSMFYVSALSMGMLLLLASLPPMRASVPTKTVILKLRRPHRQGIRPQRLEKKAA